MSHADRHTHLRSYVHAVAALAASGKVDGKRLRDMVLDDFHQVTREVLALAGDAAAKAVATKAVATVEGVLRGAVEDFIGWVKQTPEDKARKAAGKAFMDMGRGRSR